VFYHTKKFLNSYTEDERNHLVAPLSLRAPTFDRWAAATQLFLSCQVPAFGRLLLLPKISSQTQDTKILS